MATQPITKVSEEEYLRLERAAEYRSEYVGGEIFAMPGGSFRHSRLIVNWTSELNVKLRGQRCSVYPSDARVRTPSSGSYIYPDVSVICGEPMAHQGSDDILTNPVVVIEVLSPSTSHYNRGKKFELYREIPSLQEYVLAHTREIQVERFTRQADGSWIFREYRGDGSTVVFESIECTVNLADVYTGLPKEPQPANAVL